jgi:8-oxo-dGTP pyrophosphatase MutT (NUDIX family)
VPELVRRVTGRLLLIDGHGRVLLIHERAEDRSGTYWLTPGGGLEPGEAPQQAAVRETYEETGIEVVLPLDTPPVLARPRQWTSNGIEYAQTDHFFAVAVPAGLSVAPAAPTDLERTLLLGHRWWTAAELRASDATFEPHDIADLLERVATIRRTAGRVLLLDQSDRVLLIENYVDVGSVSTHWITPGGGAEPGESPVDAAARELLEETGVRIALADDVAAVHVDRESFTFNGRLYEQTNHYFAVRLAAGTPLVVAGVDEVERSVLVGERWWSLAELRATAEVVYPVGLADLVESLVSGTHAASA